MYRVQWDADTGGVLLTDEPEGLDGEMRPVFHEELDLLGFEQGGWSYPRKEDGPPLLWSVGRRYYYRGELVAEAKGGGFFEKPVLNLIRTDLALEPVDVPEMTRRNAQHMSGLVFRAIEFIRREYEARRDRVDIAAVAFSGGKDSLALLDLVQRALPPDCFEVVFNDTTMELSVTHEAVERAKAYWPGLRFHTARSHMPAEESWRALAPPSRLQRWCCSVHKSAPTLLRLRELAGKQSVRAMVFEGVRAQESQTRASYGPVSVGEKHTTQLNLRPILNWSAVEVYLYLFCRGLALHRGYRYGLSRVGCSVCPYGSQWSEFIISTQYYEDIKSLLAILRDLASDNRSEAQITEFIRSGGWKSRAGGKSVRGVISKVLDDHKDSCISYLLVHPGENWMTWAECLGSLTREGGAAGHVTVNGRTYEYRLAQRDGSQEVWIQGKGLQDRRTAALFDAAAYKAAYCVHCRACEVECPTGALVVNSSVSIDRGLCNHCHTCLISIEKGCLAARSLQIAKRGGSMKGLDRYCTFGLRKSWVEDFFASGSDWWGQQRIGPKQYTSVRTWLSDGEILGGGHPSGFGERLRRVGVDTNEFWAILWANLARNSPLIRWYVKTVPIGSIHTRRELLDLMGNDLSERTRSNALVSLLQLFRHSPLGEQLTLGVVQEVGGRAESLARPSGPSIPHIAVLYALYRYAEAEHRYGITLRELTDAASEGPAAIYGLSEAELTPVIVGLSSRYPDWLHVEFARDLDNIYLNKDKDAVSVLSLYSSMG